MYPGGQILILLYSFLWSATGQPLLFPHGWFDSANLRPRDAIYLNLLAQSHLEYGGTTVEELDRLDAVRKEIPRPENLGRTRGEDDPQLDRTDRDEDDVEKEPMAPSQPKAAKPKRSADTSGNPFEEIATRAPPNDMLDFRAARRRIHGKKRRRHNKFLTRSDIVGRTRTSRVATGPSQADKNEFLYRPTTVTHPTLITNEPEEESEEKAKEFDDPYTRLFKKEDEQDPIKREAKEENAKKTESAQTPRLPNNPFRYVDISKPTVIILPTPPPEI